MASGCRVDFYVLQDIAQSESALACRLAMMAWEQGFQVRVVTADQNAADRLDQDMWSLPAGRFLPHARAQGANPDQAPVVIAAAGETCRQSFAVCINMASRAVEVEPGMQRVLEIVPADDGQRQSAREKFRHYRDQGLDPASHEIHKT